MKLLWIIGSLNPTTGGPVAALLQLTVALRELGHTCEVATLDGEHASGVDDFPGIVHVLGPSKGKYLYNPRLISWLCDNAPHFDGVFVNGIWLFAGLATWMAYKKAKFPYFVFVHGALNPWFKLQYPLKHLKKWLYWPWAEYRILRDAKAVLFTSEVERESASRSFWLYKSKEVVVSYGTALPAGNHNIQRQLFLDTYPQLGAKRFALFLGRIHPVKGCDLLIDAFAKIAAQDPDFRLVLAGPDQGGWQFALRQRAFQLGIEERIIWTGMLSGDIKWGAFYAADVFMLPSHSENFGIVVAEALACGLPVLITDKVNIWSEIKNDGAGLVEADTPEGIVGLLEQWLRLSEVERAEMRTRAMNCFLRRYEISLVAQNFSETIRQLLE